MPACCYIIVPNIGTAILGIPHLANSERVELSKALHDRQYLGLKYGGAHATSGCCSEIRVRKRMRWHMRSDLKLDISLVW